MTMDKPLLRVDGFRWDREGTNPVGLAGAGGDGCNADWTEEPGTKPI